jgi:hypothetical protein
MLNGHEVLVTANLEAALRAFRSGCEFHGRFKLWVDALCINQENFEERARQIKMMRDIYGSAWSVVAWLGEESRQSDAAIQLVADLAVFKAAGCIEQLAAYLQADPHFYGTAHWMALQHLMDRPYWFWLWIIQEVIMGSTATWIRCGKATIDWTTFVLQEYLWLVKDHCLQMDVMAAKANVQRVWCTTSLHLVYQDLSVLSQRFSEKDNELSF